MLPVGRCSNCIPAPVSVRRLFDVVSESFEADGLSDMAHFRGGRNSESEGWVLSGQGRLWELVLYNAEP
jgi:hypothetical protein